MANQPINSAMLPSNLIGNIPSIDTKLNGCSNFSSWNFIMKMSLIGLWDCSKSENKSELDLKKGQKVLISALILKPIVRYMRDAAFAKRGTNYAKLMKIKVYLDY